MRLTSFSRCSLCPWFLLTSCSMMMHATSKVMSRSMSAKALRTSSATWLLASTWKTIVAPNQLGPPRRRNAPRMSAPTCLRPSMPGFDHWNSFSIVCARILTNFGWRKQFSSTTHMLSPCHLSCHLGRMQSLVPCVPSKTWHVVLAGFCWKQCLSKSNQLPN